MGEIIDYLKWLKHGLTVRRKMCKHLGIKCHLGWRIYKDCKLDELKRIAEEKEMKDILGMKDFLTECINQELEKEHPEIAKDWKFQIKKGRQTG